MTIDLRVKLSWWVWPLFCAAVLVCGPMPERARDKIADWCGNLIARFGTRFVNG
jgi:lauroyl/myristoyl acyltransferase